MIIKKYVDSNGHIDVIVFLNNKTIDQHIYHVVTLKCLVKIKFKKCCAHYIMRDIIRKKPSPAQKLSVELGPSLIHVFNWHNT